MQLREVVIELDALAPPALAEDWDNVGLLLGDPEQSVSRVLLTIDYTRDVAEEARAGAFDLVVAYHPPIFEPLRKLGPGSLVFDAARRGVAIYSPHTALDSALGGTNDALADVLGLAGRAPLRPACPKTGELKLVTFVPATAVETVSAALFEAGAGRIGDYSSCSFRAPGTGTFLGEEGSSPVVGQAGRLEQVPEIRLETVVPAARVAAVVTALRRAHPYEEPAFDLLVLASRPTGEGLGRVGSLEPPVERVELLERIKTALGVAHLLVAGPTTGEVRRAAVCAGACGELLRDAMAAGAELYLTGEMRHHDALRAASAGVTVVCTLHSNGERYALGAVERRLSTRFPDLVVARSAADRDPFAIV